MRIAQIVLPDASSYERKSREVDTAALGSRHEIVASPESADIVHVYGSNLPTAMFRGFPVPYVASAEPKAARLWFRRPSMPRFVLSPVAPVDPQSRVQNLPEAVEDAYFEKPTVGSAGPTAGVPPASSRRVAGGNGESAIRVVGVFNAARPGVRNMVEQTFSRIRRFRDDVDCHLFDAFPTPADLTAVDAWLDPAASEDDYDGATAEAIAAGKVVIASRTKVNTQRLEKGRTGFLVPCNDPNEMVHAILAALFKLEVARMKIEAARQTATKFRAGQRMRVLERIYEAVLTTPL